MDSISNIIMRIRGDSDDGDRTLDSFAAKLKAFGGLKSTAEADIEVTGEQKLAAAAAALKVFSKEEHKARLDLETVKVEEKILDVRAKLKAIEESEITPEIDLKVGKLDAQIAAVTAKIAALSKLKPEIKVKTEIDKLVADLAIAQRKLEQLSNPRDSSGKFRKTDPLKIAQQEAIVARLEARIEALDALDPQITVDVAIAQASANLAALKAQRDQLVKGPNRLEIDIAAAKAQAELDALLAKRALINAKKAKLEVEVDRDGQMGGFIRNTSGVLRLVDSLGAVMGNLGASFGNLMSKIGGVTVNLGMFGVKLTPTVAMALALAAAVGVSLVAALSLLVSAIMGAVAALGLLANAFVAMLGPMVGVAVAAFTQLANVLKVVKALEDSEKNAAAKTAEGSMAAATAANQRASALENLKSALVGVGAAQRGLDQAKQGAADAIVNAQEQQLAATESLRSANESAEQAFIEGHKAMKQAVEDVSDAIISMKEAQLGIEASNIATRKAELELEKFRNEAGLAAAEFDKLFDKFTDVDFAGEVVLPATGGGEEDRLRLEELILAVRQAKLNEVKATDQLSDSEQNLADKRKIQNDFARDGINAYAPYRAAIQAQTVATRSLAKATAESNRLEAQGVNNAPSVISAREALAAAEQRVVQARRQLKVAGQDDLMAQDAAKAKKAFDDLSPAMQNLVVIIRDVKREMSGFAGEISGGLLAGMAIALSQLPKILNPLRGALRNLGDAMGGAFVNLAFALQDPALQNGFEAIINASAKMVQIMGSKAFPDFIRLMTNLAVATLPFIVPLMEDFADSLKGMARGTSDTKKLSNSFKPLFAALSAVWNLTKAVGRIFIEFFKATAGEATGFTNALAAGANALADYIGSAEGKEEIIQFFKDVIPLAKEGIKFIAGAIIFIGRILQIIAPAMTDVLAAINVLLGVLNLLLGVLRPILQVAVRIAVFFVGGFAGAIRIVIKVLGTLHAILGPFFNPFIEGIKGAIRWVKGQLGKAIDFAIEKFNELHEFLTNPEKWLEAGKAIIEAIIEGIKSAGGAVGKVVSWALDKAADLLPGSEPKDSSSPLTNLKKRGKAIFDNLAKGLPQGGIDFAASVHQSLTPALATINTSVSTPRTVKRKDSRPNINRGGDNYYLEVKAPAGANPDPEASAQAFLRKIETKGGGGTRQ